MFLSKGNSSESQEGRRVVESIRIPVLDSISKNELDAMDNQDDATYVGEHEPARNANENKLQMVKHQPDNKRETPSRRSVRLLSKWGGKEVEHGSTAMLVSLKKESLTLPLSGMDDFNIFNNMTDSVILYLASICGIETRNNENPKHEIVRSYRGKDITNVSRKNC